MRRARSQRHSFAQDLAILGLELPRLKASGHAHGVELLDGWKAGELKRAFKAAARASHPDLNPGDPEAAERFKAVRAAYERAASVVLRPPPQPGPTREELMAARDAAFNSGVRLGRPRGFRATTFTSTTSSTTSGFSPFGGNVRIIITS